MRVIRGIVAVSIFAVPRLAAQHPSDTSTLDSYHRARAAVERGHSALGTPAGGPGPRTLLLRYEGDLVHRNQSRRPSPPWERTPTSGRLAIDYAGGRVAHESRFSYPGGFANHQEAVSDGRQAWIVNHAVGSVAPRQQAALATFQPLLQRLPQGWLHAALERRATLRDGGAAAYRGRPHRRVHFATANGQAVTLWLDEESALLSKVETLGGDASAGDAVTETIFPGYRAAGRLRVPTGRVVVVAGDTTVDTRYPVVEPDAALPDSLFRPRAGLRPDTAGPPREPTLRTVSPGVHLLHGLQGQSALVVELGDSLLVVDAYGDDATSRSALAKLAEALPGKRVRWIAVTHHHDDHAGGVRGYVDAGAALVTTEGNRAWFTRVLRSPRTLDPVLDTLRRAEPRPIETFRGRRVFRAGGRTVELRDIGPGPHVDEMLVAWVPEAKLVFQGDLYNPGWDDPTRAGNATTRAFAEWLRRTRLPAERVAGVHGPMVTRAQFEEGAGKAPSNP
jgi:glyoxylase-like metal-dependent hydrolase (beta-lactamase superfamily II)